MPEKWPHLETSIVINESPASYGKHPQEKTLYNPMLAMADRWPLQIIVAGNTIWRKDDFWHREQSAIVSVEFVSSGEILLEQDKRRLVVHEGQAYLLHKGSNHLYRAIGDTTVHKRYVVLSGYLLDTFIRLSNLEKTDVVTPVDGVAFKNTFKRAIYLLENQPLGFNVELSRLAYDVLFLFSNSTGPVYPPLVKRAIEYMHSNLDLPLSDETIAHHVGVSVCHIRNVFKKAMGITPLQYHLRERVTWAERLIRQMGFSIKEAAIRIGFMDPLYFSKVFKRIYGHPPSQQS